MTLERLELLLTATGFDRAAKEVKGLANASGEAAAKQTLFQKATTGAGVAANQLSGGLIPATKGLQAAAVAGGALVGVGLAKFAADAVGEFVSLASQVREFQRASGASAEDASRFVAVLDDMQISSETGSKAIFKMAREIGQGGGELAKFGVEVARNKDGTTNLTETLLNVSDAYTAMHDPAERAALVQAAFGRAGKELIPVLEQGRKGLKDFFADAEKHGQLLSDDDVTRARQLELALDDLQDTFRGFKLEAGQFLVPAVTTGLQGVTQTLEVVNSGFEVAGGSLATFGSQVGATLSYFSPLNTAMHEGSAAVNLFQGNFATAGEEFVKGIPVIGAVTSALGLFGSETNKSAETADKLKNAQIRLNELALEGKKGTSEWKDAQRDARSASNDLAGAQRDVGNAIQDTTTKMYSQQQANLAMLGAGLALKGSVLGVAEALNHQKEVQDDASVAAQFGVNKSLEVQRANLQVEQAIFGVVNAAGAKAAADAASLGPIEQQKRATDAQRDALTNLGNLFPGLREQLFWYGLSLIEATPEARNTHVSVSGVDDAISRLGRLQGALAAVGGGGIGVRVDAEGNVIPGTAGGGDITRAGFHWVGEHGPEIRYSPAGTRVLPADLSRQISGGAGASGGQPIVIPLTVELDGQVLGETTITYFNGKAEGGPFLRADVVPA